MTVLLPIETNLANLIEHYGIDSVERALLEYKEQNKGKEVRDNVK